MHTSRKNRRRINFCAGFSLIETFVAVTILLLAVTGFLTIAQKGISGTSVAKSEITAFYLASEALEAVRAVRDNNRLEVDSWLDGLDLCIPEDGDLDKKCTIDARNKNPKAGNCKDGPERDECPPLQQSPSSGIYGYDRNFENTIYTREVQITRSEENSLDEVDVRATVSWRHGVRTKELTLRESLYDW